MSASKLLLWGKTFSQCDPELPAPVQRNVFIRSPTSHPNKRSSSPPSQHLDIFINPPGMQTELLMKNLNLITTSTPKLKNQNGPGKILYL